MPAYVILEVNVEDPEAYEGYKQASGPSLARHGGRFVVRGGRCETLEGGWEPERVVVLRFDSMEQARGWYGSDDYREARELRWKTSRGKMILVEGVDD